MQKSKWIKGDNNDILRGDDFFISYNPNTGWNSEAQHLTDMMNLMGALIGKEKMVRDGEETALVHDGHFYILEGDWRKQYEKAAPHGLTACLNVFKLNKEKHGSNWST